MPEFFKFSHRDLRFIVENKLTESQTRLYLHTRLLDPFSNTWAEIDVPDAMQRCGFKSASSVYAGLKRLKELGCLNYIWTKGRVSFHPEPIAVTIEDRGDDPPIAVAIEDRGDDPPIAVAIEDRGGDPPIATVENRPPEVAPSETSGTPKINRLNKILDLSQKRECERETSKEFRKWLRDKANSLPHKPAFLNQWIEAQAVKPEVIEEFQAYKSTRAAAPPAAIVEPEIRPEEFDPATYFQRIAGRGGNG